MNNKISKEDFNNIEINYKGKKITNLLEIKGNDIVERAYSHVKTQLCHFTDRINETGSKVEINFDKDDKFVFKVVQSPKDLADLISKSL